MKVTISKWTAHYNQLLYSVLFYSRKNHVNFSIHYHPKIESNGVLFEFNERRCFLDYSDDPKFISNALDYDFYFKRSLTIEDYKEKKGLPLNFQVNFSYKPFPLLKKMPLELLTQKNSRIEMIRAMDHFNLITNDSHHSKDLSLFKNSLTDFGGNIIFMTRLWDPSKNDDIEEKERRVYQNSFRIEACRIISKYFPNAVVGVYPDEFAKKTCPDILLELSKTRKKNYLSKLMTADICIADDGLKDTPGWKIGEYIMAHKAIITTPINTFIEDFEEGIHYVKTTDRNDFQSLPDLINLLLKEKKYQEMKMNNKNWYEKYMAPDSYIANIINKTKSS